MKSMLILAICTVVLCGIFTDAASAQAFQGYTLFSKNNSRQTYLLDMNNNVVHSWSHSRTGGYSCYLLPDGSLLRSAMSNSSALNGGGAAGIVQRVAWDGTLLWEYTYSTSTVRSHHDLEPMPNGNVLMIAWEVKNSTQTAAAGLNHNATLWPDHIIEVQPVGSTGGNIVWEWHVWDHLIQDYNASKSNYGVVGDHPELIDINIGSTFGDWTHVNSVSFNPARNHIAFTSHNLDEIYVIDHSTTTSQAAGHTGGNAGKGGDILYRWGKPSNYRAAGTQVFNVVHCAYWIPEGCPGAGNLMAYNNREGQGTSLIMELVPPVSGSGYAHTANTAYGPASATWSYTATGFYSNHLGGNQRLPNGNTLIAESTSGRLFEVSPNGTVVWNYQTTGEIARALRYPASYSGLAALPVNFTAFRAIAGSSSVELTWDIASESSNFGFEVQRRLSGSEAWELVGFVNGRGTTDIPYEYTFSDPLTDVLRSAGSASYRLRQIDTDGSDHLSPMVEVNFDDAPAAVHMLRNYPNPVLPLSGATTITNIQYNLTTDAHVTLTVHNSIGKTIATLVDGPATVGSYTIPWDARSAAPGVYFCRLMAGGEMRTLRIVVGQ